jgi:surface carbohydrate biosynthesis protein
MTHPTIFIPVESKKREFDGKVLLAAHLVNKGFRVVLGTKAGVHREILHARNGLYLAKSASNESLQFYSMLKNRGHHLAVLDVEGGALTREIRNDLLRSYQPESSPFFDFFFVFGEQIREAMIRELKYIEPQQIVVTGEPRFDLLKPEHEAFFAAERGDIRQEYGSFILINTSFGLSNSAIGEAGIRDFLMTTADIPDEQRHLYLLKHEEGKYLLKAFIELAKQVAERFPHINIILRPHPDEDITVYKTAFTTHSNIFVNGAGNVHPWIQSAMAVIHHDCTTGMEAVMAGKPTISFVPRQEESITAWLPVWLSIACTTHDEVLGALEPVVRGELTHYHPGEEKAAVFASHFENFLTLAGERLAAHLTRHYINLSSSNKTTLTIIIQRFKSTMNNIRMKIKPKNEKWERFTEVDRNELIRKLHGTGVFIGKSLPMVKICGRNAAMLKRT